MTECQAKVFDSRLGAGPLLTLAAVFAKLKACIEPLGASLRLCMEPLVSKLRSSM